jgi:hypothetical protein
MVLLFYGLKKHGINLSTEVGAEVDGCEQKEGRAYYKSEVDKALVFLIHQAQVGAWFHS